MKHNEYLGMCEICHTQLYGRHEQIWLPLHDGTSFCRDCVHLGSNNSNIGFVEALNQFKNIMGEINNNNEWLTRELLTSLDREYRRQLRNYHKVTIIKLYRDVVYLKKIIEQGKDLFIIHTLKNLLLSEIGEQTKITRKLLNEIGIPNHTINKYCKVKGLEKVNGKFNYVKDDIAGMLYFRRKLR